MVPVWYSSEVTFDLTWRHARRKFHGPRQQSVAFRFFRMAFCIILATKIIA